MPRMIASERSGMYGTSPPVSEWVKGTSAVAERSPRKLELPLMPEAVEIAKAEKESEGGP